MRALVFRDRSLGQAHPLLLIVILFAVFFITGSSLSPRVVAAQASQPDQTIRPLEEFSPGFLGMYRKVMEIEDDIIRHAATYEVDVTLARALCIQESGGNPGLNSWAGAQGYFQVMPATFRSLGVSSNIEAGIKYLSQMIRRFEREDYALGAYNGGPGRIVSGRPPLETLQYILFVGHYRSVLKLYEPSIRYHASRLRLEPVREGDDWWTIAQRVGVSVLQLRLHNPFLSTRALHVGHMVAYPPEPRSDLFAPVGPNTPEIEYVTRHGDNYLLLSFVLGVDLDAMREVNGLWHLQTLPAEQSLRIPLAWKGTYREYQVRPGDTIQTVAEATGSTPWQVIRDNLLFWDESLTPGVTLRARPVPPRPTYVTHRVSSGETLGALARRYNTTVGAIQAANELGRSTVIRIGQTLRIPTRVAS